MRKILIFIAAFMTIGFGSNALAVEADVLGGVSIHGFISQGYLLSSEYNYLTHNSRTGSFEYNEMGINFSKQVTDKLRIGVQIFSRDLGNVANNKVTIDWAYADYKWQDWLGIRAGRIKMPLGIFNETRDIDMLRTCIIMPQNLYPELMRDVSIALNGVGIYGYVPIGPAGSLDYVGIVGSMGIDNESGVEKYMNSTLTGTPLVMNGDIDADTAITGRIKWNTPLSGLGLSASMLKFKAAMPLLFNNAVSTAMEMDQMIYGMGVEYTWENLSLAGEYRISDVDSTVFGRTTNKKSENYYIMASYRFTDWFELGSYYSISYADKDDKHGDNVVETATLKDHSAWQKDLALSLRFDINSNWIFKVEGHKVNGTSNVLAVDNADRSEKDWYYGAAKLTFSF